ncbi:MAG: enoyl-ACP reductase FabI [Candidatus Nitrospinota bacterium M3_3B_026]
MGDDKAVSFLGFEGKKYLVFGVANKRSVASHISGIIREEGGEVILSVENEERKKTAQKLFPSAPVYVCDVSRDEDITKLAASVADDHGVIHGIAHSIAHADYPEGMKPFHEIRREDFMRAMDISLFSLIAVSNAFRDIIDKKGSVVTVSISTTRMASESYGYMAPIKAALDSAVVFLAKSFSRFSEVRFNAVAPGLLKTSASAGIPGYVDAYLYAERLTLRGRALETDEAARVAAFLLSGASSGVNAGKVVVDAGMGVNYFDRDLINSMLKRGAE